MASQPTPPQRPPPRNKGLIAGLIKGKHGLISPDHKAGYFWGGGYVGFGGGRLTIAMKSWICWFDAWKKNQILSTMVELTGSRSLAGWYLDVPLEVSKWLVSWLQPQHTPFISRWNNPVTNHLLSSWDILAEFFFALPKYLDSTTSIPCWVPLTWWRSAGGRIYLPRFCQWPRRRSLPAHHICINQPPPATYPLQK